MSTPDLGAIRARWDDSSAPSLHKKVWAHRGWPLITRDSVCDQVKEDTAALCDRVERLEKALKSILTEMVSVAATMDGEAMAPYRVREERVVEIARAALAADPPTEGETP